MYLLVLNFSRYMFLTWGFQSLWVSPHTKPGYINISDDDTKWSKSDAVKFTASLPPSPTDRLITLLCS